MNPHPLSSANPPQTPRSMGWHQMPAFGEGYRRFASTSTDWDSISAPGAPLSTEATARSDQPMREQILDSFWATVSSEAKKNKAALR